MQARNPCELFCLQNPLALYCLMPQRGKLPFALDSGIIAAMNAEDGFITSNMAIAPTTNGSIDAFAAALTQLILDISGYFAP